MIGVTVIGAVPIRVQMVLNAIQTLSTALQGQRSRENGGSNGESGRTSATAGGERRRYLSADERVLQFLSETDGETWQSHVVEGMDWSAAKTSRVLSELEERGRITRRKIGRQKVVFLHGHEPEYIQ